MRTPGLMAVAAFLFGGLWAGCEADGRPLEQPAPDGVDGGSTASACRFQGPHAGAEGARPVLAVAVGGELRFVHADGTFTAVFRFGEGVAAAESRVGVYRVVSGANAVAAAARWTPAGAPGDVTGEMVLVDRGGAVRWSRRSSGLSESGIEVGGTGLLSYFDVGGRGWVVDAAGHERALGNYSPIGPPLADGTIAVRPLTLEATTGLGWLAADGISLSPLALPLWTTVGPSWAGDRLVYVGDRDGQPVLVAERPGDAVIRTLDVSADRARPPQLTIEGRFVLITEVDAPRRQWRLDGHTGALSAIAKAPPPMRRQWNNLYDVAINDTGDVVMGARDNVRGGLYRSVDVGATWFPVGLTVADVLAIDYSSRGGTFLIYGSNDAFVGETDWPAPGPGEPPADLRGPSLQVARPVDRLRYPLLDPTLQQWPIPTLSADGLCAAWPVSIGQGAAGGWKVQTLDVRSGETSTALQVDVPSTLGVIAWLD